MKIEKKENGTYQLTFNAVDEGTTVTVTTTYKECRQIWTYFDKLYLIEDMLSVMGDELELSEKMIGELTSLAEKVDVVLDLFEKKNSRRDEWRYDMENAIIESGILYQTAAS